MGRCSSSVAVSKSRATCLRAVGQGEWVLPANKQRMRAIPSLCSVVRAMLGPLHSLRTRSSFSLHAAVRVQQHKEIKVDVEETSWSSRKLYARVSISAPVETVWASLTDYDHLADIVPSLVENKCLERRKNGAVLRQVQAMLLCHRTMHAAARVLA